MMKQTYFNLGTSDFVLNKRYFHLNIMDFALHTPEFQTILAVIIALIVK